MSVMTSAFILELTDMYIIGKQMPRNTRDWLNDVSAKRTEFINLWRSRLET